MDISKSPTFSSPESNKLRARVSKRKAGWKPPLRGYAQLYSKDTINFKITFRGETGTINHKKFFATKQLKVDTHCLYDKICSCQSWMLYVSTDHGET